MSAELEQVAADEHGIVRLVQLSEPLARAVAADDSLAPLARALGVAGLDPDHVQIVTPRDLNDLGLAGLLELGHGVPAEALSADRARLDALGGTVAILRSRAFGGAALRLAPRPDASLIALYRDAGAPPARIEPLRSAGAEGVLDGAAPDATGPDHQASRRTLLIGVAVAVVLALLVLALTRGTP